MQKGSLSVLKICDPISCVGRGTDMNTKSSFVSSSLALADLDPRDLA